MLWRGLRVLVPLGAAVVEGWPAALGAVLFQETGYWLARKASTGWARRIFLGAWSIRVAVALPTHYFFKLKDGNGSVFQDAYTNDLVAEWLVRIGKGEGIAIFPGHQHVLDSSYTYLLAAMYAVFGHAPLLPKLLNSALGALCAVLVYEIAARAFNQRVAILASIGAALMPTLILWSVITIKETLVLTLALLGLWAVQRIMEGVAPHKTADFVTLLIAAMVLSLDLRSTTSAILLLLLVVVLARKLQPRPRVWQLAFAGVVVVGVLGSTVFVARGQISGRPPSGVVEDALLQIRHRRAQEAANARTQIRPETEVISPEGKTELPEAEAVSDATPFSFVGDVLNPLGFALLAPAPWQARSLTELAASAEMLIWDVLLAGAFFAWRVPPRQRLFVACLVAYGLANWLVLAVSEGNLGNLLRHRQTLAPALLILGTAGLDWLWGHVAPERVHARRPVLHLRPGASAEP
ncbi:MAG TPA: glycosyltransferase family 39 protein [Chloroflexota bacterium]